jgi:hypothetical protein
MLNLLVPIVISDFSVLDAESNRALRNLLISRFDAESACTYLNHCEKFSSS